MGVYRINPTQNTINRLFQKAGGPPLGWWNLNGSINPASVITAYQPKGAASYNASLLDLTGNNNHAENKVSPDWAAGTGWTGTSTSWLETNITINSNNGFSVLVRHAVPASAERRAFCGTRTTNGFYDICLRFGNFTTSVGNSSVSSGNATVAGTSCLAGSVFYSRRESNGTFTTGTHSTPGTPSGTMKIFTGHFGNSTQRFGDGLIITHFAIYSIVLTQTQIDNIAKAT